ncbi:5-methylaminomethyl-2-thiouridine-forming enzyme mnmC [Thioalkalivibrio nitratireducens DSM 14787]|uniref:tRNA 5-methylaminomethyl-2-thiouridine biosynthesis bifunctional protein MnmC n=1 Tax=Thioalkalivibrio nitratireducens (strain DSM 14787 / UNIQEM 213 / ALEN2) TaxID=1255043 RepID=L0DVY9_THIND|nr:tRNA (5-methylaminomethyl-2-thiouridine)(34)-methyltransferase MnmD [Thioalkalivibrio nitratireducens]AGA33198.1 5-methylaminomethyl-2-thiouridine-forming enzyme mnmC [Thioalkalivibrio nitratireducens DSM 14787]
MLDPLVPARLGWEQGRPRALAYDDVYFSARDPCGEVRTVFIEANDLPNRFRRTQRFALGETGFGTGLNFFLTLQTWREHAPADGFLSYLSTEAHPLRHEDLRRALRTQGISDADIEPLSRQYPPPLSGVYRIRFPNDRVVLTLLQGDAAPWLAQIQGHVDAWFLDGFAPARNPALWNLAVFRQIARLSHRGTTFGTFTAAGQVRRDLAEVGFTVQKAPGFAGKRERCFGSFQRDSVPAAAPPRRVAVVGAGIAGLSAARALRQRGIEVTVFDPMGPGGRASGNPAALLTPHLSAAEPERNAIALAGVRATHALLDDLGGDAVPGLILARGVEHHGVTRHAARRLGRLVALDPATLGHLYCIESNAPERPVLRYPDGLALDLGLLCRHLAADLDLRPLNVGAVECTPGDAKLRIGHETRRFDAAIVATGAVRGICCPGQPVPAVVGGQMTRIATRLAGVRESALSGQGYCLPEDEGQHWLGATYRHGGEIAGVRDEDNRENLARLAWVDAALADPERVPVSGAWFGARAVFPDRLPAVGMLPNAGGGHPSLAINVGYGSRGLLYAPLCGALLADRICGLPEPLPVFLSRLLAPDRFAEKPAAPSAQNQS